MYPVGAASSRDTEITVKGLFIKNSPAQRFLKFF
jgi:hypothetical protein